MDLYEIEYVDDDFDRVIDFGYDLFEEARYLSEADLDPLDSDFEDDDELSKPNTDTSAAEARNGKDIQGIPWERLNLTRDEYRETRLKHYVNFQSLSGSHEELDKECLRMKKGKAFYDFHYNSRLVKSTILHFQLRNLIWATSKHDVYLMQNYSIMHWSSLLRRGKEVLNVAKPIVPSSKQFQSSSQSLSRVQITAMAVEDDLIAAGGFEAELIFKNINQPGVLFAAKITSEENSITNSIDIYHTRSGSLRVMTANNDCKVRIFDASHFVCLYSHTFDWSVNKALGSPDGKLLAIIGDSPECLIADAHSGNVISSLKGHLDYSFASAWHPNGLVLATGNQDTTCRLWDIRNLSESFAVLKGNMGAIRSLQFTSDGRFLAMAEPADFVHIIDTESGWEECQEIDIFGEISGISFSQDTEALFVGISDRTYGSLLEFNRRRDYQYLDSF